MADRELPEEEPMLELDLAVALALALSVASTVLCVGYGLTHWDADDDPGEDPSERALPPAETGSPKQKDLEGV